jgi:hypothetical protein
MRSAKFVARFPSNASSPQRTPSSPAVIEPPEMLEIRSSSGR